MSTTEKAKHTPGPWFAGTGWIGAGHVKDGHVVCRLPNFPYGNSEANANLIAAAPEMLEALELTKRVFENYGASAGVCKQIEAVIRKAKGE